MHADIQPPAPRTVTFTVTELEAKQIAGFIMDAINTHINTPYTSSHARTVAQAFAQIANKN
jgi:hypothetical protein